MITWHKCVFAMSLSRCSADLQFLSWIWSFVGRYTVFHSKCAAFCSRFSFLREYGGRGSCHGPEGWEKETEKLRISATESGKSVMKNCIYLAKKAANLLRLWHPYHWKINHSFDISHQSKISSLWFWNKQSSTLFKDGSFYSLKTENFYI